MKFWKAMVSDYMWWTVMAVLWVLELALFWLVGFVSDPVLFSLGFWLPTPAWYYVIVYRKWQKKA